MWSKDDDALLWFIVDRLDIGHWHHAIVSYHWVFSRWAIVLEVQTAKFGFCTANDKRFADRDDADNCSWHPEIYRWL